MNVGLRCSCHMLRSMDKLFDLMAMGYKYQLVCTNSLDSLLQVCVTQRVCVGWVGGCMTGEWVTAT
jgi:hypothetical protein